MANRFSQTEKYGADWFLKLNKNAKFLYYYLNENFDHGGFYSIGFFHISICLDLSNQETEQSLKELDARIVWSDDKTMIWLKNFLDEQNNLPLNHFNNAHRGVVARIKAHYKKFQNNLDLFTSLPCEHKFGKNDPQSINEKLGDYLIDKNIDLLRHKMHKISGDNENKEQFHQLIG
jgi:hypothetical protein